MEQDSASAIYEDIWRFWAIKNCVSAHLAFLFLEDQAVNCAFTNRAHSEQTMAVNIIRAKTQFSIRFLIKSKLLFVNSLLIISHIIDKIKHQ